MKILTFDTENKLERLNKYVDKESSSCWLWLGSVRSSGYGYFRRTENGIVVRKSAHRYFYTEYKGEIPEGLYILHTCDNPLCVNPEHLYAGTAKQNAQDREGRQRGQHVKGENQGSSKLTDQDILNIRASSDSQRKLAKQYNVSQHTIWCIVNHITWRHVV